MSVHKVLIYRLGSLGDTVVALPSLHLIARAYPDAERRVLTNFPVTGKDSPFEAVIGDSGLVQGYFRYPVGTRDPKELWELRQAIRRWSPEVLVYLTEPRGRISVYRDVLFFLCCGIRRFVGVPYAVDLQKRRKLAGGERFESEAQRLARCIGELGKIDLADQQSWDLHLSENEDRAVDGLLPPVTIPYLTVSAGAKVEVKDWGESNWKELLDRIASRYPTLGLVLVGASEEKELNDRVSAGWKGPRRNLCGATSPRSSAAIVKRSVLYLGHDGGPMHLAAAVGVPCVAIFSARSEPGVWFPSGDRHHVIYHPAECGGCRLDRCEQHAKRCIASITVQEVFDAVCGKLSERNVSVR